MFVMVDCAKEITMKKSCKYGEYGSFEHLLLFFPYAYIKTYICYADVLSEVHLWQLWATAGAQTTLCAPTHSAVSSWLILAS